MLTQKAEKMLPSLRPESEITDWGLLAVKLRAAKGSLGVHW